MIEAVTKIPGLHQKRANGCQTNTIFMGWDAAAVEKAASEHAANEEKSFWDFDDKVEEEAVRKREREREQMHQDYLDTLAQKKGKSKDAKDVTEYSPVGSYIVESEYLAKNFQVCADNLRIDIHKTDTPGVFQANFEFEVFGGIMMICLQPDVLEEYCLEADRQAEFSEDSEYEEDEESESEGRTLASGSKRKASGVRGSQEMKRSKKHQPGSAQSLKYRLKIRCRETGEIEIQSETKDGTLQFADERLASFVGESGLPCWGQRFSFSARKISDVPAQSEKKEKKWAYYSERRHEYEWARRWY
ncbi:hypothetical protein PEBR_18194 [Penicillium brasilianum]|uniref:Uncharacterized protein n=1 Tax=Penicillium brasilianum TaxID=104259 RepID=A0A1S9RPI1_PENBI|nr:hypothetical protein PEBR_18194 [Penicillium brasilianum]